MTGPTPTQRCVTLLRFSVSRPDRRGRIDHAQCRATVADFLAWPGDGTGRKFQLVDGEVRAMSPASAVHSVIQGTWENVWSYCTIPSVQEIAIVHSARVLAEMLRRGPDGHWRRRRRRSDLEARCRSKA
jgi:Putative restriction endonuclease